MRNVPNRMKFGALLAAGLLAVAGCSSSDDGGNGGGEGSDVSVGLAYDIGGRGDQSFNDSAAAGLDRAVEELGVSATELEAGNADTEAQKEERLRLLASDGANPVIAVGFAYAESVAKVAAEFPDTNFAIVDETVDGENVASLVFAENEGSYLVGAIAAQASQTGRVGFVGGVDTELIKKFEAGYVAGAQAINPDIQIDIKYLTSAPDFTGFSDPAKGKTAAEAMYQGGADVVYHAAGGSGTGVFEAAKAANALAIGVDSDQYLAAPDDLKPVILTSMIKRVDNAVFDMIQSVVDGSPLVGVQTFDLAVDGVGYSTSNSAVDPYIAKTDELKQQIISGAIKVPTTPQS